MTHRSTPSQNRFHWFTLITILVLGSGGCASTATSNPPAHTPAEEGQRVPQPAAVDDYVMRYGDVLDIKFFYNPELNETVPIRPDGRISLELVGEVKAAGLTPSALTDLLRERYAGTLRNPEITVILTTFSDRKVFVGGEVKVPRAIDLSRDHTAFQAIIEAGGFKPTAHLANIIVLRDQGTAEPLLFVLDYKQTVKLGTVDPASGPDLKLQPNDIVFVPKTRVARWGQLVDQYYTQLVPISLSMGVTYFVGSFVP